MKKKDFPLNKYYSKIYKHYDLINRLITFGWDDHWRKLTAEESLVNNPSRILDLCCGTGVLTFKIHEILKNDQQVTGFDFNENMLAVAVSKLNKHSNIKFVQGDAASLPFADNYFDTISISFGLRNLIYENKNSEKHLKEISRVLSNKGRFVILESSKPRNKFIYFFYWLYLHFWVSIIGGIISGNFKAYYYLSKSSSKFLNPEELQKILAPYGFTNFKVNKYFFGSVNLIISSK